MMCAARFVVDGSIVRTATGFDKRRAEIARTHAAMPPRYPSIRSMIVAIPCPTPMHIVASP